MAKYPFIPQAAEHVQNLNLQITELDRPEYRSIVERAEERIREAVEGKIVSFREGKEEVETLSFPVALMMVAYGNDASLKKRFALGEANRALTLLKKEDEQNLISIAKLFNWKIRPAKEYIENTKVSMAGFTMDFVSYLKNTTMFHESEWKLVNRTLQKGEVLVTKDKVARLLAEQAKAYIEKKLELENDFVLSKTISDKVENLKQLHSSMKGNIREEEALTETVIDAFPPCISKLYNTTLAKQHLSHLERFTLASFLLNSGMSVEDVIECFRPTSDFNEKITRYQVEHIAGRGGSRTTYSPPDCRTLRTHRICPGGDEICERVGRPTTYYRRKLKVVKNQTPPK